MYISYTFLYEKNEKPMHQYVQFLSGDKFFLTSTVCETNSYKFHLQKTVQLK